MAEAKKINPLVKTALELGPVILFFVGFTMMKDQTYTIAGTEYSGFLVMTAALIVMIAITSAIFWALTGTLSRMQLLTLVLVVVMGGISIWLKDERFIKMKPTLVYVAFGTILGFGLWRGQSYLSLVMDQALPLKPEGWMILTRRLTLFLFVLAAANEAVWRLMSTEAWVNLETFGTPVAMFAFFMAQARVIDRYSIDEDKPGA
ncbi:MAG: septation protein IspZ [Alphaproteobacteria bacterium]|nr:septation protein IspZ [Alphaproteobacteria bacterium]